MAIPGVPIGAQGAERQGHLPRPMRTIDGDDHFCEVFLDEVHVPVEQRVGAEHDGWRVANVTLRFERGRLVRWGIERAPAPEVGTDPAA